ncbi:hypothetical protein PV08_00991 [Exophiala spinifera]|uniref:Extracellular membrane protein CFEM domain-containing protein n=1 Tax=Exophiala spinifera TaxID=91928 RepID=A0A0D1YYQ0_9EURO|nr:uncharacterized protein PV08_00991 [Exophiala spinifera]KIW20416.1 hypothetical protein PV08_00991 [Exophiala spinifera]
MATLLLLGLCLASSVAGANVNLTSAGCVDPSGLQACQNKVNEQTTSCINQAKRDSSQQELLACSCADYINNYNCYAAFCWNRVWECEYQEYVISYMENCATAKLPVPYFPAPDGAADACSCNLGKVHMAVVDAIQETATCSNNADSGDASSNVQQIQGCNCCEISGAFSSIFEICPNTDPTLIGLSSIGDLESELNTQFSSCGPYLETYDCISSLSYSLDGVSTFLKPSDPLQTGTDTLSNGPGSVTTPASGQVFSYTNGGDGVVYTITAATGAAEISAKTSAAVPGSGSAQSGSDSTTSAAKSTGTAKSSGARVFARGPFTTFVLGCSALAVILL